MAPNKDYDITPNTGNYQTGDDLSKEECRNLLGTNITTETQAYAVTGTEQTSTMPERRKTSSSPQMTSTPKVKRKGYEDEETTEMRSRLGLHDKKSKSEVSQESLEMTSEYTDGTTRPTFKKRLRNTTANAGELVQLECVVSGSPLPKVLWLKNNRPLKASDGCKVIIDGDKNVLVFPAAKDEDVGIYTARAMNVNGSIMCSAEFNINEGKALPAQTLGETPMDLDFTTPAYFFQMSSCEVAEGRLARFDCRVVAYPRPEIVWMRDGKVVETSDRFKLLNFNNEIYSLLIQDVQLTDTGRYTCWARNKFGEAMTEAYLNVIAFKEQEEEGDIAPKFLTRFYDQQTTEGTPADFKCLVAGRPEPSVTWLLDDLELKEEPGLRMRKKDGVVSLEIKSPKTKQSGQYTCQLKNTLGDATCSAKLTVIEDQMRGKMLPKFLKKFDHVNAKQGEEAKFTCVVVGEPKPNIVWMYNHKEISDTNRRYVMKKEGDAYTLIIKDVRFDDKGIITCKATNEEGEVYISANLHVRESKKLPETPDRDRLTSEPKDSKFGYVPTFTKRLEDVEAKEGASARFECRIMGIPEPEVSWMKDGRVILPGGRYHMTQSDGTCRLLIDNVTSADTGVYTCIISNSQGKSSSTASLKLEREKKDTYTPDKPVQRELFTPEKYSSVDKTHSRPSKRAYEGLERIEDMTKKFADLPEMRAPPRLPARRPVITDMGEDILRLAWQPAESYQAKRTPPVSYRLEAKELPGKDWMPMSSRLRDTSHYLSELPLDRDFMIRVRAENDFGVSEPTEPLWLPRARAFPGVPVSRPDIVEVEDTRAKLSWTRVDIPSFGLDEDPLLYMLEVEEPPHDWRTIARDLDDTEYIVEGLKPGKDYRFRIRAKTPAGVISEPSPAASLYSTLARSRAPVDRLQMVDYEPDSRSINLQWERVGIPPYSHDDEPLLYMLEYQEPPMHEWRSLVTGIPTTKYRVMHLDPDRDYNFRVRAVSSYGLSPPSPILPVSVRKTTAPSYRPLDEAVVISEIEPDSLRLSWSRPMYDHTKPISYKIEMMEFPLSDWKCIAASIPETSYRVTGLRPNKDYQFKVTPQVDRGYLTSMPPVSLTSSTGEPETATRSFFNLVEKEKVRPRLPLTEPTLRELTAESVSLHWKPAEVPVYQRSRAPLNYTVEMLELPSSTWVPVARRVPDTLYTVTGLRPDLEYKFRVKAEINGLLSEPSLAAPLHRRPVPKFPRKEPTIKDLSPNVVQLSWQPAVLPTTGFDDITYRVEIQSPPGISTWNTLYANHPTPSVRLADLRPDLDYLVRVRAVGKDFVSEPTMPVYIPRRAVPPRMPHEEPYLVDINPDSIKLQWRSADLPSHIMDYSPITYRLEAQEMPNGDWITVARGIPHTDFKVTGLNPLCDYSFRVRAENDYGLSDPTRTVAVQKRSVAPVLPHDEPMLYDVGPGSVRLTWRPASLPSHIKSTSPITYTIFVQELPFTTWRPLVKQIPHTSYYISGLQSDKEYNFRVQAENMHGHSRPTQAVYMPKYTDTRRPISMPEVSDFDEDVTFVNLRWKPQASPLFDKSPRKYQIESWEPVKREWKSVARGIKDTSYKIRDLPKLPDHLFRVRMETELKELSEPSLPVSIGRHHSYPNRPVSRPQLFEYDNDSVRLSWQPAILPEGVSRRSIRYVIEQREIPDMHWHSIASDVTETSYRVRGLRPKSDYEFRIRVVMSGISSEPSFPVALYRRSVIPRVKLQAPEVRDVDDTTIVLHWNKVDVPSFSTSEEPLLFMIERQTLPGYQWEPIAMDVVDTSYTVHNLKPFQDYNFRVRGVYPSGYTDPSPFVPVYRRPISRYVPIARPEIWEEEPYSARLRWHRAYIPRYYKVPLRYRIEMQEAGETAADWKPVATAIQEPDITVNELSPRKDYNFRIRAELENGEVSDPTPPLQYHRSKVSMTKEPFALAEYKPVEYDHVSFNRSYIDHLTKFVPPRLPIDKPDMVVLDPETVELSWRSASVPQSIRHSANLTYTIEVRNPPSFEWRELVSGLKVLNHKIPNLHSKIDYVFRVRAWNEYGCSEASLPVSIYRPIDYNDPEYYDEDEEFEREWELRFGQQVLVDGEEVPIEQVPPKLPIDTPKTNTQTETSIWFTWLPARIPAYATQTPITYVVEMKEPPSTNWRRDVTGILDCQYIRDGLDPKKDYHIRVRAETEFGTSEPTLPIMIQRSKAGSRPGSRLSSMERELKDDVTVNTSFLDSLTSSGPPRMTAGRPQCSDVQATSLTLSWSPSRVPSYVKSASVTYIIEKREPPGHIWCVVAREIAETSYKVSGLNPEQDYMFRVRAKNEHGVSDPTLPVSIYRERDDYVPQKIRSRSGSRDSIAAYLSIRSRRSSSVDYGSGGSGGVKSPREETPDNKPRQPEYIETTYDTQYGVEGKKGKINLKVKGYPLPKVHWYFGEEKLKYGDQFNTFITPEGGITLELKNVNKDSVGEYKCYAENEHGASVKVVTLALAEAPTVLEPLTDQILLSYNNIILTCKVDGYPNPNVKWMKDWKPLAESARVELSKEEPEEYSLVINNGLATDSGVYACVVENAAGKVTTACRVTVEDAATPREVTLKKSPIEELYTILEEVRRGEHGVTRRVVEIATGNSFEATFVYMRNRAQKNFFLSEFEVLRTVKHLDGVLKIHDAFETDRSLIFVTEPLPGVSLLEKATADGNWVEADVAAVIRSLLNTLKEFETLRVLYLDMRPSNVRMCGSDRSQVKLVNFAMSRVRDLDEDVTHNYGTVGYASPEQITNDVLTGKTDSWGIGVLTYILLTGNPPFTGETDTDILNKAAECQISFDDKDFGNVSKKAQDFIQKLLVKQQSRRMSIDECMRHPWITAEESTKINTNRLSAFNNAEKASDATRQVQTTAVLQSLSKIRHGTAALYQPAIDTKTGEIIFPDSDEYGDYLDEDAWYEWQLQYCDDPDSQTFPLMDANFTVRESKHTAEKKKDLDKEEPEEPEGDGSIYFRNKIQPVTFSIGDDVTFMCTVVSTTDKPIVTWYRDETLLSEREAYRTVQLFSEETGIAQLIIQNAKDYDGAVYKCVARNKEGRVSCEARLLLGDKPVKPGRPVVIQTSGNEVFLTWSSPVTDGNSYILGYRVDYRKQGTTSWIKGPYMTEEYALVSGLVPESTYVFRVSCHNKYGTSPFSWASLPTSTLSADAPAIAITGYLEPLLQFSSFTKQQLILPAESRRPSLSVTPDAKVQKGNPADFYDLGETVSKGKYGEYKQCTNKTSNRQCVAKVMPFTKETHVAIKREFEILKNLRQLHIITVLDAYIMKEYCYVIFEQLSGLNIIQYLCLQKSYREETIARVVKQILDALQYLQTFGIVHLNLQPSSVAMSTRRRPHIKLRDFTAARKIKDGKVENMRPAGYPDFVAPEVIKGETIACPADMWSLGVLTFTLLSGVSPFEGGDLKETLGNILFDRYKASDLYDNTTKESVRFINALLRRLPTNRPTVSKCLKSRWLQLGDQMLASRTTRTFQTERLRDFLSNYTTRRADAAYMDIASVPVEDLPKPNEEKIADLCTAIDDALMFC